VARQYNGLLSNQNNCQIAVTPAIANEATSLPATTLSNFDREQLLWIASTTVFMLAARGAEKAVGLMGLS
jgi:hypothetical protein